MLEIRPARAEDLPALSALFADRFGHGLTPEEWQWKYQQISREGQGRGRSLVAVDAGAVLAHAGALALPARWPGSPGGEGLIWQLVDFAGITRRRGLRAALVDLGKELLADLPGAGDAPWIFGFPSERHFRLGEKVFGYRPLTTIEPLVGALPDRPAGTARIDIGDVCGEWAETVWERCGGLGVRRSSAFLNWRYYARPQRYYRVYRMFSEAAEGFAVFAFVGSEALAAELWLPAAGRAEEGEEWYPSMLAVAADLRAAGFRSWRFWPGPGLGPGLDAGLATQLGLRASGESRFIGCRGRSSNPVLAAAGFPYSMGDYDLV